MTPTLLGRWQTRFYMMLILGPLITIPFAVYLWVRGGVWYVPFVILFWLTIIGWVIWDPLYMWLQGFRWDRDWPPAFQFVSGVVEAVAIYVLLLFVPWLFGALIPPNPLFFLFHYWTVWWITFLWSQGPMRLFFPRWRFFGGQWLWH